jgi:SpoVK/Ycf46/Vps4 family AAA+-type ATPase
VGILLAGDPGVGKTLTAYVTAKKAVDHGWTFVYLSHAADLANGIRFALQYAPCVLFVEDLDRIVAGDDRTEEIDDVLNSFDGVDSKDKELITVLTTNHLEKIPGVALRPGRCDTLVVVTAPTLRSSG